MIKISNFRLSKLILNFSSYENALVALKKGRYNDVLALALAEYSSEDSAYRLESSLLAARFYFFHNQITEGKEFLAHFKELYNAFGK